ncbi:transmembrane anchor protein [Microvirga arsenatis]|uniref:Transmembrane anchor protein n=1 Tax=Microvirga arsenatis TaxID=2692265 RepID=A0ABW9YW26_9HYPH|nr:transmembrane anchor protein [Microvirga arsenatis]NBJ09447.1 transmembrane anchor protein [Microvirga arsenatis]NBJ23695.1 transmembrane anchor protein [Microvirga arsenatis]
MYNTDMPTRAELPSSAQLVRSTFIAAGVAAALLVTVVLPSEYGIDPTGAGRALGLTEMGEIKTQLADEAEADRAKDQAGQTPAAPVAPTTPAPEQRSSLLGAIFAQLVIGSAQAQTPAAKSQEIVVTLQPGEGTEVKADMKQGAKLTYSWKVDGGTVNHDTHGAGPGGKEVSYSKGRGVPGDEGEITAGFDGGHGWFWRNRGSAPVTVKLTASGDFGSLKQAK